MCPEIEGFEPRLISRQEGMAEAPWEQGARPLPDQGRRSGFV